MLSHCCEMRNPFVVVLDKCRAGFHFFSPCALWTLDLGFRLLIVWLLHVAIAQLKLKLPPYVFINFLWLLDELVWCNFMPHIAVHELVKKSVFCARQLQVRVSFHWSMCSANLGSGFRLLKFLVAVSGAFQLKWGCHRKFSKFLFIAGRSLQGKVSCDEYSRPAGERGISSLTQMTELGSFLGWYLTNSTPLR